MIANHGIAKVEGVTGSSGGYWSRSTNEGDIIQHSLGLFDTEENARVAKANFGAFRSMAEAPATLARGCG
jgi:hypothetical protein